MAGRLLVLAQFAVILALAWPATAISLSLPGALMAVLASALGIWTICHNRPGNFNIHPEPKATGRLITSGPYSYVRHPMYVALLLFGAAVAIAFGDYRKTACWLALALVLWAKSVLEERALRRRFPDYPAYASRVCRFIPGLF